MTVEEMLEIRVPAPFVKGQIKRLGDCTIQEVDEARRVLEATTGDQVDIDFLRKVGYTLRSIKFGDRTLEGDARYKDLKALARFRENQTKEASTKKQTSRKSKTKKGSK